MTPQRGRRSAAFARPRRRRLGRLPLHDLRWPEAPSKPVSFLRSRPPHCPKRQQDRVQPCTRVWPPAFNEEKRFLPPKIARRALSGRSSSESPSCDPARPQLFQTKRTLRRLCAAALDGQHQGLRTVLIADRSSDKTSGPPQAAPPSDHHRRSGYCGRSGVPPADGRGGR